MLFIYFFSGIVLHIQVLDKIFYRAKPMGAAQNTVFAWEILWIIAFKAEDQ